MFRVEKKLTFVFDSMLASPFGLLWNHVMKVLLIWFIFIDLKTSNWWLDGGRFNIQMSKKTESATFVFVYINSINAEHGETNLHIFVVRRKKREMHFQQNEKWKPSIKILLHTEGKKNYEGIQSRLCVCFIISRARELSEWVNVLRCVSITIYSFSTWRSFSLSHSRQCVQSQMVWAYILLLLFLLGLVLSGGGLVISS